MDTIKNLREVRMLLAEIEDSIKGKTPEMLDEFEGVDVNLCDLIDSLREVKV
jgi:hypothetical protein